MKAQFRILSGARAGQTDVFSKLEIVVGRHPSCDLKLHPEQDLDASSRHAVITKIGNTWTLRDLQSRNGVLLNGHKTQKDTRIDDTDLIQLGASGPRIEFRIVADSVADTPAPTFSSSADAPPRTTSGAAMPKPSFAKPPVTGPRPMASAGPSTTQRIRVEVAQQTKKLKRVSVMLAAVLVAAVGAFFAFTQRQERARERELVAMRAQMDSLQHSAQSSVEALRGQVAGLASALRASQSQVQGLQTQLTTAQATGDRQQVAQLRRQLDDASLAVRNQQIAAQVDFNAIYKANQRAVGMIYVKFDNGSVFTGTAFAVRPDGIMLTNKHLVRGKDGTQTPREIAMQFADSKQVWQTQVLAVSDEVDLAVVRVTVGGPVPPVKGLSGTATQPGDPVAVIGFPLGLDLPMQTAGEGRPIVKTSLNAGTVSKVLPDRIQFDGYGAEGASGSPIFDRSGEVMAVLFGGEPGTNGRVVYGVPVSYVTRLLQQIN